MDFESYLHTAAKQVAAELNKLLERWEAAANKNTNNKLEEQLKLYKESHFGGKGLRGSLVKLGYELTGAPQTQEVLTPAAAFELLHTALLIQDDIADHSLVRRGQPAFHRKIGGEHYGTIQSFFISELGMFLAHSLIIENSFSAAQRLNASNLFSHIISDTLMGEMLDIELSRRDGIREERDVLLIHKLKSAPYSVWGPLSIGALFGGADAKLLQNIKQFGEYLGIAFQMQDDILGVFGDEKTIGKSVLSDCEENKNTLLITYALQKVSAKQRRILKDYYGKSHLSFEELQAIRKVFIATGSLAYSQAKAEECIENAKTIVLEMTKNKTHQMLLQGLADFIVKRKK